MPIPEPLSVPEPLIASLRGVEGFDEEAFRAVHASGEQVTSLRVNPLKWSGQELLRHMPPASQPVPWTQWGYYLSQRPSFTFDPLFHAGCYYVQEASSMFLEQALGQWGGERPLRVLDLCGAPGGKATHLQALLPPGSLLVTNEVIKSRLGVLVQNILKWGASNVVVTNNDPQHFSRLEGFFDVLVVDAPCSGSGLFRREPEAIEEWSLNNVALCSQRQQRILAAALPALRPGGLLVYSTCSYSPQEDEEIADWLVGQQGMESLSLQLEEGWGIVESASRRHAARGYRFFPDKLQGEGFFLACFRKQSGSTEEPKRRNLGAADALSKKERAVAEAWLRAGDFAYLKSREQVLAIPRALAGWVAVVNDTLNMHHAGVVLGAVMHDKLVPHHSLAVSTAVSPQVADCALHYEQAISYLQKGELAVEAPQKGWQTVSYQGHRLGWINALERRINNYYPKEMRILKQQNGSAFKK